MRWKGFGCGAQDLLVQARARALAPGEPIVAQHRLLGVAGQSVAGDGADVAVQQSGIEQLADHEAEPAGGVEMVHVGEAIGIDPRISGVTAESAAMSPHSIKTPAARAIAMRCRVRLVDPPVACRPTMPLTKARSSSTALAGV